MNTFEPILGGSFDQIAAQRFGWGRQNLETDTGNVNRFTAFQAAQDAKVHDIAAWNQANATAQYKADEGDVADAESARRFGITTDLAREANQTRYGQEAERTTYYNRALGQQQANVAADAATVDSAAQTLAPRIHEYGTAVDSAQAARDAAFSALQSKPVELQASLKDAGVFYNGKVFVPVNKTDSKAATAASQANLDLAAAQANFSTANAQLTTHQKNFANLSAHAQKQYGLEVSHDGDQWVVKNPQTQRTYRPNGTAKPGPKPMSDLSGQPISFGGNRFEPIATLGGQDIPIGSTWPGFTGSEDSTTPNVPELPASNRFSSPPDQSGALFSPANLRFRIPAAPAQMTVARVRVKSPDGKTGSIPANQLDDAIANGYVQVQ